MAPKVGKTRRTTRNKETTEERSVGGFGKRATDRLNKKVGENTAVDLRSDDFIMSTVTEFVSTQCYGLDYVMHLPGIPVGRVTCIRGDFMSGKSTIALHIMAETQKMGGFVCYMDTEYAFDKERAQAVGVDLSDDKFMLVQAETVEDAVKSMRELVEAAREEQDGGNSRLVTIVWDSVGATGTEAELEADFGDSRPGLHARLLSAALRQLTPKIAKYRICLLLINQEKERVDFGAQGKGIKTMIAEKPIMFHSTIVLRPQHRMTLTNSKQEPTGIRVITTVKKNKLAAPFSKCEFIINFSNGIDNNASILGVALQMGLVKKSGAWYSYSGQKFYERDFGKILAGHPEIMEDLEAARAKSAHVKAEADDDDFGTDDEEMVDDPEDAD